MPDGERRRDDPHAQHRRRVPGRDRADHAGRDAPEHRQAARAPRSGPAGRRAGTASSRRHGARPPRSWPRGASCCGPRRSRAGSTSRTRAVRLVDLRRPPEDRARARRSSSRPRRAGPPAAAAAARATSSGVDWARVSSGRPLAGSRISLGAPVPGRQSARNGSSQPAASDVVGSGAVVAIGSSFGRLARGEALRVGLGCVRDDRALPGRGVAPDRAAGQHGVDQAVLEVGGVLPGADGQRRLARVADALADVAVGVVAADDDQLQRAERRGIVRGQRVEAGLRVVAELGIGAPPGAARRGRAGR